VPPPYNSYSKFPMNAPNDAVPRITRRSSCDLLALAFLLFVTLVFFWPMIFASRFIPQGGGDLVSFLWPQYSFAAQSMRSGSIPLWNPQLYSGAPFLADNQAGVLYPINLFTFLIFPAITYPVLEGLVVFHIWLAGACMYAALRIWPGLTLRSPRLNSSFDSAPLHSGCEFRRGGALLGAVAFMFNDVFVTHIGNLNLIAAAAWLPLIFALFARGLARREARTTLAAGGVFALALLAGHAQLMAITAVGLVAIAVWQLILARDERSRRTVIGLAALAALVAAGLSALQLLPSLEMTRYSLRSGLSYDEATAYSLPPTALASTFSPLLFGRGPTDFWGPWPRVETSYIGVIPLLLAGYALTRKRSNPAWFFAALGLMGLLIALGKYTPIYSLIHSLPVLGGLRAPARFILLTNFSLAALAALGLERWRLGDRLKPVLLIVGAGVVSLSMAFAATGTMEQAGRLIAAVGALLATGLLVIIVSTRRSPRAAIIVVALAAVELIVFGSTVEIDRSDPTLGYQHQAVIDFLRADQNVFRIENASSAWQPDAALVRGLSDIGGIFNPLGLANYETYRGGMGHRGSALYNFLGAKYVLADKAAPPGDASFVPVFNADPQIDVYLNTRALPRALLIDDVQIVRSGEAAWEAIHAPEFNPARSVVIETNEAITIEPQAGDKALAWGAVTANRVELNVQASSPTMLVLSDVYYPGWIATLDDRPATIYPANFAFRAVLVPGGAHRVVFQFDPVSWKIGLLISAVTVLGLAAWAVGRRLRA
jgi:hypothetical protein